MNRIILASLLVMAACSAEDEPLHAWRLSAEHARGQAFMPIHGKLSATLKGPLKFSDDAPRALTLDGDSKRRHCLDITADLKTANLPAKNITVEAWVRLDTSLEWGSFISVMQDNGEFERGWVLGYGGDRFFFGLVGASKKKFTYLKAGAPFQTGYWYHVVGTYDGVQQRIYVDGRLQAQSTEQSGDIEYPAHGFYCIGAYHDDDEFFAMAGRLAQISIFNKTLAPAQIVERFERAKEQFPGIVPVRPNVVDWPTFMRDNQRTGQAAESPKLPLHRQWVYKARYAPKPASPEEAKNDYYHNRYNLEERLTYDRVYQLVGVRDKICFGSSADDKVYCLDANTGRELWAFQTEGPVRLAPTIAFDRVLFGSDDGYVYCVRLNDGQLIWKTLAAPSPRRIPGNERIISAWPVRTDVFVEDGVAFACAGLFANQGVYQLSFNLNDGSVLEKKKLAASPQGYLKRFVGRLTAATGRDPTGAFVANLKEVYKEIGPEVSSLPKEYPFAFIGGGDVRFGGGDGKIGAFNANTGGPLWKTEVEGRVHSLAIVGGRLLACTDKGYVYCFADTPAPERQKGGAERPGNSTGALRNDQASFAESIEKQARTRKGYCLVLGSGDGALAAELAKRTEWDVVGREPDAARAEQSQRMLNDAGLAGRATIHCGAQDALPYTDYLFNVVIVDSATNFSRDEALRVLRPGGIAIFDRDAAKVVRKPKIDGAGEWTHMYADPANTACSGDKVVGGDGEFQIQWFGPPGARELIDRHHRTVPPLYKEGRLFVPAEDRVYCVDAYNGINYWDVKIPQSRRVIAFRDASYMALADDALYIAAKNKCLAFDPATGAPGATISLPLGDEKEFDWGYLATVGDAMVGSGVKVNSSRRNQSHIATISETHWDYVPIIGSDYLFASNRRDGQKLWTYRSEKGLIINPTITIANSAVYFVESANPETMQKRVARAGLEDLVSKGSTIIALDLKTGSMLWQKSGEVLAGIRHNIFASSADGLLLICGSRNSGPNKKVDKVVYDIAVFDAKTGERKWVKAQTQPDTIGGEHGEQERHPVLVNGKIYIEPSAYELATGKPAEWRWPWIEKRRTGCGVLSASANSFFFRDTNVATFDITSGKVRKITRETRPGCWINLLPAGGLLLAPEASSGCTCNFAVQTSMAFLPVKTEK